MVQSSNLSGMLCQTQPNACGNYVGGRNCHHSTPGLRAVDHNPLAVIIQSILYTENSYAREIVPFQFRDKIVMCIKGLAQVQITSVAPSLSTETIVP